jgi:hypothetical protein
MNAAKSRWSWNFGKIVAISTGVGVLIGLGFFTAIAISMIPDWQKGYTGMFGSGFGLAIDGIYTIGPGLIVGFVVGLILAGVWSARRAPSGADE